MIVGISGALSNVYCTIGLYIFDRIGRIKPLIVGTAGCGVALLVNAVQAQYMNPDNAHQLRSMVAMNLAFSLFYTPTGIISRVYPEDIFPVEVRALRNSLTTFFTNWAVNLVFAQFSLNALDTVGFRYFYLLFALNLIAAICYRLILPRN